MSTSDTYSDGRALYESVAAAARANQKKTGIAVRSAVDRMVFDRFLCRIFSEPGAGFALKGGTGMLARIPMGRATQDVDLEHRTHSLEAAIKEITRLAAIDLVDFHTFTIVGTKATGGLNQPDLQAARLTFEVMLAGPVSQTTGRPKMKRLSPLSVDLAIHHRPTAPLSTRRPEYRLPLKKPLIEHDYLIISVEDQIADKAAAMMDVRYAGGQGSSRAKDLVDIALLALHESIDADYLRVAAVSETARRDMPPYSRLVAGLAIQRDFRKAASKATAFPERITWLEAETLANAVLAPVLAGAVIDSTWNPRVGAWQGKVSIP